MGSWMPVGQSSYGSIHVFDPSGQTLPNEPPPSSDDNAFRIFQDELLEFARLPFSQPSIPAPMFLRPSINEAIKDEETSSPLSQDGTIGVFSSASSDWNQSPTEEISPLAQGDKSFSRVPQHAFSQDQADPAGNYLAQFPNHFPRAHDLSTFAFRPNLSQNAHLHSDQQPPVVRPAPITHQPFVHQSAESVSAPCQQWGCPCTDVLTTGHDIAHAPFHGTDQFHGYLEQPYSRPPFPTHFGDNAPVTMYKQEDDIELLPFDTSSFVHPSTSEVFNPNCPHTQHDWSHYESTGMAPMCSSISNDALPLDPYDPVRQIEEDRQRNALFSMPCLPNDESDSDDDTESETDSDSDIVILTPPSSSEAGDSDDGAESREIMQKLLKLGLEEQPMEFEEVHSEIGSSEDETERESTPCPHPSSPRAVSKHRRGGSVSMEDPDADYVGPQGRKKKEKLKVLPIMREGKDPLVPSLFQRDEERNLVFYQPDQLRKVEYPHKRHKWSYQNKVVLCLLMQYYEANWNDVAAVFNKFFKAELVSNSEEDIRKNVIQTQWHTLRTVGIDKAFVDVCLYATRNGNRPGVWSKVLERIEVEAAIIDIELQRALQCAPRRIHKRINTPNLSRFFIEATNDPLQRSEIKKRFLREASKIIECNTDQDRSALMVQQESANDDFATVDTDIVPSIEEIHSPVEFPEDDFLSFKPALVFRCYDDESAGMNGPRGFKAEAFKGDEDATPCEPLEPNHPFFDVMVANHLWYHVRGSPFVSTTTSFFTAFRKAMIAKQNEFEKGETRRIRIACIDFSQIKKNSFFSADCIKKLKSRGILRNMRYKGTAEFLTWGEIPASAILGDVPFDNLLQLSEKDGVVQSLLRLDEPFSPADTIKYVRTQYHRSITALTPPIATALGKLWGVLRSGRMFSAAHISDLVASITDAFVVEPTSMIGMEEIMLFHRGMTETYTVRSRLDERIKKNASQGFLEGIVKAQDMLERERKRIKRRLTRNN